ncbi:MAG: hypothetical protein HYT80_08380 [Euryarchaeota archaeon]|nr:hypothetical protein [Euryarchaeota archaeon]
MGWPTLASLASAILLFPVLSAAPPAAIGSFDCGSVKIAGDSRFQSLLAFGLWLPFGNGTFSWHAEANELEVFWVRDTYLETGQPSDPSKPQYKQFLGQETGNQTLHDAKAGAARIGWGSQALAFAEKGASLDGDLQGALQVRPTNEQQWTRGNPKSAADRPLTVPTGTITAEASGARASLAGNLSLSVSDAYVNITDKTSRYEFRAGNWTEGIAGQSPSAPVRYRIFQWVRLVATGATMEAVSERHPLLVLAREVSVEGNVSAEIRDFEGTIDGAGGRTSVRLPVGRYEGEMRLTARNETALGNRLAVEIVAAPSVLGVDDLEEPPAGEGGLRLARSDPGFPLPLALTFAAAAGLLASLALVVRRRRFAPGLGLVERELRRQRPEKARQYANRRLAREPADGSALFFLATTYLVRKDFGQLLAVVEPRAELVDVCDRRSVAYLLAVAAHAECDVQRLERWGKEAAMDLVLEAKLALGGIWTSQLAYAAKPQAAPERLPLYA